VRLLAVVVSVTILCVSAVSQSSQCSKEDVLRLAQAGYKKAEVEALCQTSSAFFSRSALAEFQPFAVRRFVNSIVPVSLSAPSGQKGGVWLEDVQYCRTVGEHKSEMLGFGEVEHSTVGGTHLQSIPAYAVFQESDCSLSLNEVTKKVTTRIASNIDWFVSRVEFEWIPWKLRLRVLSSDTNPKFSSTNNPISSSASVEIPTSKLQLAIGNQEVSFNMAFYFSDKSMSVIFLPEADAMGVTDVSQVPALPSLVDWSGSPALPDTVNARFLITHKALNFLADTYFNSNQAVTVQTGVPALGSVQLKNLRDLSSNLNQFSISGVGVDSGNKSYACRVDFQGSDIQLRNISIEPQDLEKCPPLSFDQESINCNARNATRSGGAELVAQALNAAYGGRALKTFGKPDKVRLNIGSTNTDVSVYVSSIHSTPNALELSTWITFARP
jgi:hypothetical protein